MARKKFPRNLLGSSSINVLAYSESDHSKLHSCRLTFRYHKAPAQFTLSLAFSYTKDGANNDAAFILVYDADNLVPSENPLGPTSTPLPQDRLAEVTRNANIRQIKTLFLILRSPCLVYGLVSSNCMTAAPGADARADSSFLQFTAALAIGIVFDYNYIHEGQREQLKSLFRGADKATSLPLDNKIASRYQRLDLSVRESVEITGPAPPYSEAPRKRTRQPTTSTSPRPPPTKRAVLLPSYADALSPTERGTTASTPTPKPSLPRIPSFVVSEQAIDVATAAILPELQSAVLSALNFTLQSTLQSTLRSALPSILPGLVQHVSAAPPATSPSLISTDNETLSSFAPTNTKASPSLSPGMRARAAHLNVFVDKACDDIEHHATQINKEAGIELDEVLENHRLNIDEAKELGVDEIRTAIDEEVETKKQEFDETLEEVSDQKYAEFCNKIDEYYEKKMQELADREATLSREKEQLKQEQAAIMEKKLHADHRYIRVKSAPP